MPTRSRTLRLRRWLGLAAAASLVGTACAGSRYELPDDFALERGVVEENAPLGGEALGKRKEELRRAYRDMVHFHATLEALRHRRDRSGFNLFRHFLDAYMGLHLEPLLKSEWQSEHPEVMGLDANLRFVSAGVLIRMRATRRVQDSIDQIAERFAGREDMLVDYPVGSQSTLRDALEKLRDRKWRG